MCAVQKLSLKQAQKIIILTHKLQIDSRSATGLEGTLQCLKQLGYVQIDSISVLARAHHHTIFNRVKNYKEGYLSDLLSRGQIFEYWSHAAALLPIDAYKYSLPAKQLFKNGDRHCYKTEPKVLAMVLAKITDQGPCMAKDFANSRRSSDGWWDWKPAKIALEQLYMQGDLMVSERRGFQKVYDLTSRVLPADTDTAMPSTEDYCQYLITHYLRANGVAKREHFGYLLKGLKVDIKQQLAVLLEQGFITEVLIQQEPFYALLNVTDLLSKRISRTKVKILSPFDNLLIQRKRMHALFDFNYQLECYVPAAKRQYGYFSLPILQGQNFVARMDVKIFSKEQRMVIQHLHLHTDGLAALEEFLADAVLELMRFQQANILQLDRITSDDRRLTKKLLTDFKLSLQQRIVDQYL
ncbi:MAG: hypothetical protein OFPII_17420 [Osedax symbiont Rs1]|nr:MAG: hypothetical protein OFPII_17420 [Osedax symbiont Rs1]